MFCHTREVFEHKGDDSDPAAYIVSFISDNGLDFTQEPGVRLSTKPSRWDRYIGAAAPSLQPHPNGGVSMVFTTIIEPPWPWNNLYLENNAEVLFQIESDLEGRAKMGPEETPK